MSVRRVLFKLVPFFIVLILAGCSQNEQSATEDFQVTVRLAAEPDYLNPIRSKSASASPIESLIMLPLAEYDPVSLELVPMLVTSRATIDTIPSGRYKDGLVFHYEIRPEANWDDGSPVTGFDYAFTVKTVLNPEVASATLRGFLSFIKDVQVDPSDPKKFAVVVPEPYMLAEAVTCNFLVLPKYVYDPSGYLDSVDVADLSDAEKAAQLAEENPKLKQFAEEFAAPKYSRDIVAGAGPYKMVEWVTNEHIILERKKEWWGDNVKNAPELLHGYPTRIIYQVIPDETSALSALKDGTVDLVAQVTANNFVEMRDDPQWNSKFNFYTPTLMQQNYVEINNRHPLLRDKRVRKALALAIDYDAIVDTLLLGMAERTASPFHPSKKYYDRDIAPEPYSIEQAKELLKEAGWEDTNNNNIVDKVIDGKLTELNLDVIVTQRAEGQQIALLMKQTAAKAGIDIDIVTKDGNGLMQAIRSRDFEMLLLRNTSSPSLDDPYQRWHTESDQPGGGNRSGFSDPEADEIMEQIRETSDENERNRLFIELQEIIYDQTPVIFLYVPTERLIVNKRIQMTPSSRRPGFFENLFQPGQI